MSTRDEVEPILAVYQDGRDFYGETGELLFSSAVPVLDGDIDAAREALAEFMEWARQTGLTWHREWGCHNE